MLPRPYRASLPIYDTDTAKAHGSPLGNEEVRLTKEILGLPPDESFWVPDAVLDMYRTCIPRGQAYRATWEKRFADWNGNKEAWEVGQEGKGLPGWEAKLPSFDPDGDPIATRKKKKKKQKKSKLSTPPSTPRPR